MRARYEKPPNTRPFRILRKIAVITSLVKRLAWETRKKKEERRKTRLARIRLRRADCLSISRTVFQLNVNGNVDVSRRDLIVFFFFFFNWEEEQQVRDSASSEKRREEKVKEQIARERGDSKI